MAKKIRLSQQQKRRVRDNSHKKLNKKAESIMDDNTLGPSQEGLVISRFGQHADVEADDGSIHRCNLRRSINSLVTGDKVVWRQGNAINNDRINGVIEAVHTRKSVLTRPDMYDGIKPIAANIDQVLIVTTTVPEFSTAILDRYLVAIEDTELNPVIILNKHDLLTDSDKSDIEAELCNYQKLGYQVLYVSNKTQYGLEALQELLNDRVSIFVGQSGVGKSTLVNSLMPEAKILTQEVSENSGLGQHTTTTARLYHFESGGKLIDSPGIREFSLWHLEPQRIAWCFTEFRKVLGTCKFRDCRHDNDPGCAIQKAAELGEITPQRLSSYHRIITSMAQNKPNRHIPI